MVAVVPSILLGLYSTLFVLTAAKLSSIFTLQNKILNFRNGILLALFLESVIRIAYWTFAAIQPHHRMNPLFRVFYFIPVWLNFAGLSLLCAFYAKASMQSYSSKTPLQVCFISNIIFLTLNVSFALLAGKDNILESIYICYAVFLDALTAVCVGYFGSRFVYNAQLKRQWVLPCSIKVFSTVNWIIMICFLMRSLLVAILSFGLFDQQKYGTEAYQHRNSWTMFCFFFFTEWVPNISMLYMLWNPTGVTSPPSRSNGFYENDEGISEFSRKSLLRGDPMDDCVVTLIFNDVDDDQKASRNNTESDSF